MKKILFFIVIFCAVLIGAKAQNTDATINDNYVKYWVGTGSNQAIFIINWCDPDTALAWGFRFSEDSMLVSDMIAAIEAADPRLSHEGSFSWLSNLTYTDGANTFQISYPNDPDYITYNVSGQYADVADAQYFYPGDYVKFGGYSCALTGDSVWIEDPYYGNYWMYASVWNTTIEPVELPGVPVADVTIDASEIQYWVGTGSNEVRFIVDWCSSNTAYAWGYRFDGESVLVSTILNDIANADPRFSYEGSTSWLADLVFVNNGDSLKISPDYVAYNVNGGYADVADAQYVHAGDYVKFGAYGCAHMGESVWVEDDWGQYWMYASVWTGAITPVPSPVSVNNYDSQKLSIYPNPCTESIRIQTNVNDNVILYNLQGAVVMNTVAMDEITTLDVNNLPAGIYFVKSGNKTAKIVKR